MESVTVLVPFDFINHITRTSQKTLLSFDFHIIHCIVAVSQFFGGWKYQRSKLPFWIFNSFFKCVAISHPLNPGTTPWYVASNSCICTVNNTCLRIHAQRGQPLLLDAVWLIWAIFWIWNLTFWGPLGIPGSKKTSHQIVFWLVGYQLLAWECSRTANFGLISLLF